MPSLINTDQLIQELGKVKIGGINDDFSFPPTDNITISTYHYNANGQYTGKDYAIVSLAGAWTVIAVIIFISIITFFIFQRIKK